MDVYWSGDRESHAQGGILVRGPGESCTGRYTGQGTGRVMHREVYWSGDRESCTGRYTGQGTGSHAQGGILVRGPGESCTVRYTSQGTGRVMHSEVYWPGDRESHAQ